MRSISSGNAVWTGWSTRCLWRSPHALRSFPETMFLWHWEDHHSLPPSLLWQARRMQIKRKFSKNQLPDLDVRVLWESEENELPLRFERVGHPSTHPHRPKISDKEQRKSFELFQNSLHYLISRQIWSDNTLKQSNTTEENIIRLFRTIPIVSDPEFMT